MSAHLANWQTVAPASELVPGQFLEFRLKEKAKEPAGMPLTGFAFLDGTTPRAYLNVCPHLGIELNWMPGRFWPRPPFPFLMGMTTPGSLNGFRNRNTCSFPGHWLS